MTIFRWLCLSLGVLLVGAALIGAAVFAKKHGLVQSAALAMRASADEAPRGGHFEQRQRDDFRIIDLDVYKFSPSRETRDLVTQHAAWRGTDNRVWYEFAPDKGGAMPLVILLHGAGRDGLSLVEMWKDVATRDGIALLAPDGIDANWRLADGDPDFIAALVEKMIAQHDIDPARIYLFGHSAGATYAQYLLNRIDGPWTAAALHAGYAPLDLMRPPATAKPYRLYIGTREHIFSLETAENVGRAMAQMGHDNDLMVISGHTHWLYQAGPQIAADAWAWLDSRAR